MYYFNSGEKQSFLKTLKPLESVLAWFPKAMPFHGEFWICRLFQQKPTEYSLKNTMNFYGGKTNRQTKAQQSCTQMDKMQRFKSEPIKIKLQHKFHIYSVL